MTTLRWLLVLTVGVMFVTPAAAQPKSANGPSVQDIRDAHRTGDRWLKLLNHVTQSAALAPSPILVMGLGGAYQYFTAKPGQPLGFFAQPSVFGSFLLISLLVLFKDSLSVTLGPLKPVVDSLAALTHSGGALLGIGYLASGIFDPGPVTSDVQVAMASPGLPVLFAQVPVFDTIGTTITFLASLVVYGAVWVVFNMIEAVILINPIPMLELVLKSFRTSVIGVLTAAAQIHPVLGMLVALPVIIVCLYLSHFAIRVTVIALTYAVSILFRFVSRTPPAPTAAIYAFSSRHFPGVPLFTRGRLTVSDSGQISFAYHRLFLFWPRVVPLPADAPLAIGIGTINPYVLAVPAGGESHRVLLRFSPRYLGHHQQLHERLKVSDVRDVSLVTSIRQAFGIVWDWVRAPFAARGRSAAV
jgi:hypothetical protein